MISKIRRSTWNTYATYCYTYDVANDQRSAGGTHNHQVRLTKRGWQTRIRQSNGAYESFGPITNIDANEGETLFAKAELY